MPKPFVSKFPPPGKRTLHCSLNKLRKTKIYSYKNTYDIHFGLTTAQFKSSGHFYR